MSNILGQGDYVLFHRSVTKNFLSIRRKASLLVNFFCYGIRVFICYFICYSSSFSYPINSPYSEKLVKENILFSNFSSSPKHLDPARSYSEDEYLFIAQIYEPPYEYHYLIRPYKLVPLSAESYITEEYVDKNNKHLANDLDLKLISSTVYNVKIKSKIFYQPHPAFVKDIKTEQYKYHNLNENFIASLDSLNDFDFSMEKLEKGFIKSNSRELEAKDFVYQIKRLADPKNQSPIYSFMAKYIIGLEELHQQLIEARKSNNEGYLDLNNYELSGVTLVDKYSYQIKIKGNYPQFKYWFAMLFFAPMPWEADKFYSQAGLKEKNISLDTYPVGTGAFMLINNNPNRMMVLEKNPYYNHGFFPTEGEASDQNSGIFTRAGKPLPFLDKAIFYLEKESIPIWNKFLQGYYDMAGISSDNFNQAVNIENNTVEISDELKSQGISLVKTVEPGVFYWGFNMQNETVGGYDERAKKLRRALSIAFNVEEFIAIFRNGRGIVAHSPIPPGISQYNTKYNQYIYNSNDNKKSIAEAKKLLTEAGYENGIDPKTDAPLVINFDATLAGDPSDGARLNWMREQFEKLNIKLNIRATQYNKFQDKIRSGSVEMFSFGWNADYPDPENFLFLFLCEQSAVKNNGENSTNYCNPKFEELFENSQATNDPKMREGYINQMIDVLQQDNPWIFGFYNEAFQLRHSWMNVGKPLAIGNNTIKYISLNPKLRITQQNNWNQAIIWPVVLILLIALALVVPVMMSIYIKNHKPRARIE